MAAAAKGRDLVAIGEVLEQEMPSEALLVEISVKAARHQPAGVLGASCV